MAKDKLKIDDLKVQSIVTSLDKNEMQVLKGGKEVVGRRRTYTVRWTMIDTRTQPDTLAGFNGGGS